MGLILILFWAFSGSYSGRQSDEADAEQVAKAFSEQMHAKQDLAELTGDILVSDYYIRQIERARASRRSAVMHLDRTFLRSVTLDEFRHYYIAWVNFDYASDLYAASTYVLDRAGDTNAKQQLLPHDVIGLLSFVYKRDADGELDLAVIADHETMARVTRIHEDAARLMREKYLSKQSSVQVDIFTKNYSYLSERYRFFEASSHKCQSDCFGFVFGTVFQTVDVPFVQLNIAKYGSSSRVVNIAVE